MLHSIIPDFSSICFCETLDFRRRKKTWCSSMAEVESTNVIPYLDSFSISDPPIYQRRGISEFDLESSESKPLLLSSRLPRWPQGIENKSFQKLITEVPETVDETRYKYNGHVRTQTLPLDWRKQQWFHRWTCCYSCGSRSTTREQRGGSTCL